MKRQDCYLCGEASECCHTQPSKSDDIVRHESEYESCFLECQCLCDSHLIKFQLESCNDDVDLYVSMIMDQHNNYLSRLFIAIKYLFGFRCDDCQWDCTLLKVKDVDKLISMLYRYKKLHREKLGGINVYK